MSDLVSLKYEYSKVHILEDFSHTLNYDKYLMIEGYEQMAELNLCLAEEDCIPLFLDYEKELDKL